VGLELCFQLIFRQGSILDFGSLGRWLRDGARRESKFDLFATLVVGHVGRWNSDHTEDFDFVTIAAGKSILNAGQAMKRKVLDEEFDGCH
jgi:hypothetical protein